MHNTNHQKCFLCPKILPENYDKGNICEECAKDQEKFETRFDTYYGRQEIWRMRKEGGTTL